MAQKFEMSGICELRDALRNLRGPIPPSFEPAITALRLAFSDLPGDHHICDDDLKSQDSDRDGADEPDPEQIDDDDSDSVLEDDFATAEEVAAAVTTNPNSSTIEFISEQGGGLHPYALIVSPSVDGIDRSAPDIVLYDVTDARVCPKWSTVADIAFAMGDVVWANLTSYKLGHGWRFADVLAAVGIDHQS